MNSLRYFILATWIVLLLAVLLIFNYWWSEHPLVKIETVLNGIGKSTAIIIPQLTLSIGYFFHFKPSNLSKNDISKERLAFVLILLYAIVFLALIVYMLFFTNLKLDTISDVVVQVMSLLSSVFVIIPMTSLFKVEENPIKE